MSMIICPLVPQAAGSSAAASNNLTQGHHAAIPGLPLEVCDMIIDHLWDNYRALRACNLTCRAWRPAARRHLFSTILVSPTGRKEWADFFEKLPHVAPSVEVLKTEDLATAFKMLPLLPKVRKLAVECKPEKRRIGPSVPKPKVSINMDARFPSVKTLSLHHVELWDPSMKDLVSIFPAVSALNVMDFLGWGRSSDEAPVQARLAITSLHLEATNGGVWYRLEDYADISQLHMLSVSLPSVGSVRYLATMLEDVPPTLRALTLGFGPNDAGKVSHEVSSSKLLAEKLAPIRVLHLQHRFAFYWREVARNDDHPEDTLLRALRLFDVTHLEELQLTVEVRMFDRDDLAGVRWADIARHLLAAKRPWPRLVINIRNVVNYRGWVGETMDTLMGALEALKVAGYRYCIRCRVVHTPVGSLPSQYEHGSRIVY